MPSRRSRAAIFVVALMLGALTFAMACSSSKSTSATPTRPPAPTAFPEPTIDADTVSSPLKGYTAKLPANFHLRANFATDAGARFPTDAFFGPKNPGDAQPSIAMTCYAPVAGKTLDSYRDDWNQFIGAFSSTDIQISSDTVNGLPAYVFNYIQTEHGESDDPTPVPRDYTVRKRDYIFLQEDCRWTIAFLTPSSQFETYKPVIDAFIATLKFATRLT